MHETVAMAATCNEQEAAFLASHTARQERLRLSKSSRNNEARDAFWEALKGRFSAWTASVDAMLASSSTDKPPSTEEDKRHVRLELDGLSTELKSLRKTCLASSSYDSFTSTEDASQPNVDTDLVVPADLSVADVQQLHRYFTASQERLDKVKTKLLPKGKFVFRRYREAMARQQAAGSTVVEKTSVPVVEEAIMSPKRSALDERTLQNLQDARIVVHADGRVEYSGCSAGESATKQLPTSGPLVLRTLQNCQIVLHGVYAALHLVSLVGSTVVVRAPVQGPVHVTDCHKLKLRVQCQQLRLHESTNCTFRAVVFAGAILEDCRRIVFQVTNENVLDVKDFDWLRKDAPSPNFTVEAAEEDTTDVGCQSTGKPPNPPIQPTPLREVPTTQNDRKILNNVDDSDEEDEL